MYDRVSTRAARAFAAATFATLLAGCAGGAAPPPGGGMQAAAPQSVAAAPQNLPAVARPATVVALSAPPSGVVKSKQEKLKDRGGKLSLPKLKDPTFSGSFGYPTNNAASGATADLGVSYTNAFNVPPPPEGTPIYYAEVTLNSNQFVITFGAGTEKGKVQSSLLKASQTYTLYGYVAALGSGPAFTINLGSPNAQGEMTFDSPFNGVQVPTHTAVTIQLVQD